MSLIIPNKFERVLVKRELRSIFYLAGYYWSAALLVGVTIGVTIVELKSLDIMDMLGTGFSQVMMTFYFGALTVGAFIIIPPVGAIITTVERDRNCLDLLLMTPAHLGEIFNAKVQAVCTFFLIAVAATLPVIGVVFFFIGVDLTQLTSGLVASLIFTVGCASIGVSTGAKYLGSSHSVLVAYFKTFIFIVFLPTLLCNILPLPIFFGSNLLGVTGNFWIPIASTIPPILYTYFVVRSCRRQTVRALRKDLRSKTPDIRYEWEADPIGFKLIPHKYVTKVELHPRGRQLASGDQQRALDAMQIMFSILPILIFSVLLAAEVKYTTLQNIWCSMYMVPCAILFPVVIGTRVSREHERRTFGQLCMTLISPNGLVLGDLASSAISFCFYFLIPPLGLAAIAIRDYEGFSILWSTGCATLGILLYLLLILTGCQFGALLFRTSLRALLAAYFMSFLISWLCWPISNLGILHLVAMAVAIFVFINASFWIMRRNHYMRTASGSGGA